MATQSEKGRDGYDANEGIHELWQTAAELNRDMPGAEWVPIRSILIIDDITPRADLDEAMIAQYREAIDFLPPIVVQRDTFVLIDGRHRIEAHLLAAADHIRIIEEDVDDVSLHARAVELNQGHGIPLTQKERERAGKRIIRERPSLNDTEIAKIVGVSSSTVSRWRREMAEPEADESEPAPVKAKKIRAALDWMDEAMKDFEEGAEAVAAEVDPDAIDGHIAQAERFGAYVGDIYAWTQNYLAALRNR